MAYNPKLHKKLLKAKPAKVSLDSLLGLLSSAYGTEEIDSAVIFDNNTINWQNLSVENFKSAPKKQATEEDKEKHLVQRDCGKTSVGTSTTSLKPSKSESDIDITLVSIKSLENFKRVDSKSGEGSSEESKQEEGDETDPLNTTSAEPTESEMDNQKATGDGLENLSGEKDQRKAICGFYIDDSNHKLVFDVKFMKKLEQEVSFFKNDEPEVSLCVIDTTKQTKADIKIDKSCLVSKVQYFADVDKEFGLEQLDVTMKCNSSAFHWIIQWIKADVAICKPNLNDSNLKTVLLMAYHLKIDHLVQECLDYFHQNCKSVLETDWEIEDVLDDKLFSLLVLKFSSVEIDAINDYFESFKTRMYTSLIRLLVEAEPNFIVGHFSSLATIFQCGSCEKFIPYELSNSILCRSDCNQLDFKGVLVPFHEQLPSWDLSKYIELMYSELGCWKIVYWRLWGKCHFLKCSECKTPFPLEQYDWCPYHPGNVEYFPMNSYESHPIGTYNCCSEVAFKFNVLKPYGGCKWKSHKPELIVNSEIEMFNSFQTFKHLICCQPPEQNVSRKFVKLVSRSDDELSKTDVEHDRFWWSGVRLAPQGKKDLSIIPQAVLNKLRNRPEEKQLPPKVNPLTYKPSVPMGIMPPVSIISNVSEQMKSTCELPPTKVKKNKQKGATKKVKSSNVGSPGRMRVKRKKLPCTYQPADSFWLASESIKDNQDGQRDFEEIAMRSLVKMLTPDDCLSSNSAAAAGTYLRLEADWWQDHCLESKVPGSSKTSGTIVNRIYPLSWLRKPTF